jgi:hypothetical protein
MLVLHVEGLGLKSKYTSSLAKVREYQNATIYLDVSDNSAYSSFKVMCHFRG